MQEDIKKNQKNSVAKESKHEEKVTERLTKLEKGLEALADIAQKNKAFLCEQILNITNMLSNQENEETDSEEDSDCEENDEENKHDSKFEKKNYDVNQDKNRWLHTESPKNKCNKCDFKTNSSYDLNSHIVTDHGIRPTFLHKV